MLDYTGNMDGDGPFERRIEALRGVLYFWKHNPDMKDEAVALVKKLARRRTGIMRVLQPILPPRVPIRRRQKPFSAKAKDVTDFCKEAMSAVVFSKEELAGWTPPPKRSSRPGGMSKRRSRTKRMKRRERSRRS